MCTICQEDSSPFDVRLPSDCLAKERVRQTHYIPKEVLLLQELIRKGRNNSLFKSSLNLSSSAQFTNDVEDVHKISLCTVK